MAPIFGSDFGSVVDVSLSEEVGSFCFDGIQRLKEEDDEHILLKHKFYSSIGLNVDYYFNVIEIHRNVHDTTAARARCGAFMLYLKAMAEKRDGNANVLGGWFGTSKDGVRRIMNNGIGIYGMADDRDLGVFGVHIFSELSAMDSVLSSTDDSDGLRHVVYCRVILGNVEEIPLDSRRSQPSSDKFDSGVDNLTSPRKYIVWYPDAKTHILPLYVLSIKLQPRIGLTKEPVKRSRPSSPWISFRALLSMLSNSLPPPTMFFIRKLHCEFMERKITRQQLIFRIREVTGDKLLISAIKSFQDKQREKRKSFSCKGRQNVHDRKPR